MVDFFNDEIEEKKHKKSKNSNFNHFDDEIGIDEKDNIKDKVTSLRNFLDIFQKRMEGYEYVSDLKTLTYTGRVLAGTNTIQKLVGLLSPFSENTNLIGEVKIEDYYRKKHRIHSTANTILLTSMDAIPENYNTIMEMFKNTFVNIGNVINNSKQLMSGQFNQADPFRRIESDV